MWFDLCGWAFIAAQLLLLEIERSLFPSFDPIVNLWHCAMSHVLVDISPCFRKNSCYQSRCFAGGTGTVCPELGARFSFLAR